MGQGAEYILAAAEACRVLRSLGHHVIALESHAAAFSIDARFSDTAYVETLNRETIEKIIRRERPHALLATVGGQTALNAALMLHRLPASEGQRASFFGSAPALLETTQSPEQFARMMNTLGAHAPESFVISREKQGMEFVRHLGFPLVVRAVLAPGSIGTAITYNRQELERAVQIALAVSPVQQAVVEKSLAGSKRTEWEIVRDGRDNVRAVGCIEYIEPLGIHSADSPAVLPVQSLRPDEAKAAQALACQAVRRLQLTGTATVQLAHCGGQGALAVVSVTPRVTRTTVWCARFTGLPLIEWHVRLSAGQPLDALVAGTACAAPDAQAIEADKCWCRLPLFPGTRLMRQGEELTTYTKSIGGVAGAGHDFISALQRAIAAGGLPPLGPGGAMPKDIAAAGLDELRTKLKNATPLRLWQAYRALQLGAGAGEIHEITGIAAHFLERLCELQAFERRWVSLQPRDLVARSTVGRDVLIEAKQSGCGDEQLARSLNIEEKRLHEHRAERGVVPRVRTLAPQAGAGHSGTEFRWFTFAGTPEASAAPARDDAPVLLIGPGAIRFERLIEVQYCLAEMVRELHALGRRCVLIARNPLHFADALGARLTQYIEPLNREAVSQVIAAERPGGVILQFVDRDARGAIAAVEEAGIPFLGTGIDALDRLATRERFNTLAQKLDLRQPPHGMAENAWDAYVTASDIGYPVMAHPARAISLPRVAIWYDSQDARNFLEQATSLSELYPLSIERFLEEGKEFEFVCIGDTREAYVAGVLEHIEEAGVHAADSGTVWPPRSIPSRVLDECGDIVRRLVRELRLRGLVSVKCVVADDKLFVLDVVPGATRSMAFVHRLCGGALLQLATRVVLGSQLRDLECPEVVSSILAVRAPVFPFSHFPGSDASLGPVMCSVGEAVGISPSFGIAYAKAQSAAGTPIPTKGMALISVADRDKDEIVPVAKQLRAIGFTILATAGTAARLHEQGVPVQTVCKVHEGRPNVVDRIIDGDVQLIINTPGGKENKRAETDMRHEAVQRGIPVITTIAGARATVAGIDAFMRHGLDPQPLQEHLKELRVQRQLTFPETQAL
ncbi:carbamoyl-phosphate synthase large subunit [bacterium]|nr:carbamoyl-phosphate synthase large subunit [bacterium]